METTPQLCPDPCQKVSCDLFLPSRKRQAQRLVCRPKQGKRYQSLKVQAISAPARPQQPKGGKALQGEWATSIPIVGETFEFLKDHFAFVHKR